MRDQPADSLPELKRRLVEATRQFDTASDVEEKALLSADVRELERLVAITAEKTDPSYLK